MPLIFFIVLNFKVNSRIGSRDGCQFFFTFAIKIAELKMETKNLFFSYRKSILVTIGILYLSFSPPSTFESAPTFLHSDKIVHFAMFFVLTAVLIYEFIKRHKKKSQTRKFLLVCILFPIALGGVIEIKQEIFFKPRSGEWLDWAADIAGVLAAWIIFLIAKSVRAKNFSPQPKSNI